jgi:hypothetical protein
MALKFEQPNFNPNAAKMQESSQNFQALQGIPSLMMQYATLKQQRQLADQNHKILLSEGERRLRELQAQHGTGGMPAPAEGPPNPETGMAPSRPPENLDELQNRIGESGLVARSSLLRNQNIDKPQKFFYLDPKSKRVINPEDGSPIESFDPQFEWKPLAMAQDSGMIDVRKGNLGIRTDSEIEKLVSKFKGDARVKKAYQSLDAATDIKNFVDSGNPIAANSIPTYSARMSGEVGNLSEADKRPFGGSQAILKRIDASLTQMSKGTLTPDNAVFIKGLTDIVERRAYEKIHSEAVNTSKQKKGLFGLTENDIYNRLYMGPEIKKETENESPEQRKARLMQELLGAK